jgi:hypothetical protein
MLGWYEIYGLMDFNGERVLFLHILPGDGSSGTTSPLWY